MKRQCPHWPYRLTARDISPFDPNPGCSRCVMPLKLNHAAALSLGEKMYSKGDISLAFNIIFSLVTLLIIVGALFVFAPGFFGDFSAIDNRVALVTNKCRENTDSEPMSRELLSSYVDMLPRSTLTPIRATPCTEETPTCAEQALILTNSISQKIAAGLVDTEQLKPHLNAAIGVTALAAKTLGNDISVLASRELLKSSLLKAGYLPADNPQTSQWLFEPFDAQGLHSHFRCEQAIGIYLGRLSDTYSYSGDLIAGYYLSRTFVATPYR